MSGELLTGSMRVSDTVCEPGGALVPGAIAVLADSCLGMALIESFEQPTAMVTSHLHIEFMRQVRPATTMLSCGATVRCIDGSFGLTDGTVDDGIGNQVARATLGGVFVASPDIVSMGSDVGAQRSAATDNRFSDVDALLGTDVVHVSPTDAVVEFQLGANFRTCLATCTAEWARSWVPARSTSWCTRAHQPANFAWPTFGQCFPSRFRPTVGERAAWYQCHIADAG